MSVGDVLAVWGAVTGTVGAYIAIANLRRDAPRLNVGYDVSLPSVGHPEVDVSVHVTNVGKQPIAIRQVGLAMEWEMTGRLRRQSYPTRWISATGGGTEERLGPTRNRDASDLGDVQPDADRERTVHREAQHDTAYGGDEYESDTELLKPGDVTGRKFVFHPAEDPLPPREEGATRSTTFRPFALDILGRPAWGGDLEIPFPLMGMTAR